MEQSRKRRAIPLSRRIMIVDDDSAFGKRLGKILRRASGLTICGEAATLDAAIVAISQLNPDLVLVGLPLPESILQFIQALRAAHGFTKVLVVSSRGDVDYANRVLRAGADGYIVKQKDAVEVVAAIRDVLAGHIYVSEGVLRSPSANSTVAVGPRAKASHTQRTS